MDVESERALSEALKGAIRWLLGKSDVHLEGNLFQLLVRYYNIRARIVLVKKSDKPLFASF